MVDKIRKLISEKQIDMPPGTQINYAYDESKYIRSIILDLENNMISGFILVMIVTIFFLGFVNSLFVSLAIPFSMLLSFIVLEMMGVTLNMVVLFSLILALGMLVDNGIVIVENIFRHGSMGKSQWRAAVDGASEVAAPVISSTITTVLAFFPIIFMPDVMGDFMKYVPITVIVVLSSSLLIALTINPVYCSKFMKISDDNLKKMTEGSSFYGYIQNWYEKQVTRAVNHSFTVLIISLIVVITGIVLYSKFGKEPIFFSTSDPSDAVISLELPQGTALDKTETSVHSVEQLIADIPASLDNVQTTSGRSGDGEMFSGMGEEYNKGYVRLSFKEFKDRKIKGRTTINALKERMSSFVGARVKIVEQEMGPPSGHDISYDLVGDDYAILGTYSDSIASILNRYPEMKRVENDYESAKPEISVAVDRLKAAHYGLSVQQIAGTIRNAINGNVIGKFRQGEEEYDIVIRYDNEFRKSLSDLQRLHIVDDDGIRIPLNELADITPASSVGIIKRRNLKRSVGIWADFQPGIQNKKQIQSQSDSLIRNIAMPQGYRIDEGAGFEMRKGSTDFLLQAFMIALFLIAIVLVAQFNSVGQPFIIMVSVFLSLGGVFWGYLLSGQVFVVILSGIGCIALAGVAVNNCIVLVDYTNKLIHGGVPYKQAVIDAGKTRLRPVLLTAITTVLGLIPMAFGISIDLHPGTMGVQIGSEMSDFWAAFAWAMIYGLTFATVMTLVMVPCMLNLYFKWFPPNKYQY